VTGAAVIPSCGAHIAAEFKGAVTRRGPDQRFFCRCPNCFWRDQNIDFPLARFLSKSPKAMRNGTPVLSAEKHNRSPGIALSANLRSRARVEADVTRGRCYSRDNCGDRRGTGRLHIGLEDSELTALAQAKMSRNVAAR